MATITFDDLWVCIDCTVVIANGDWTGIDDPEREAEIEEGLASIPGHWVLGEGEMDFSWRGCDCCGSPLGGSRHEALVLN